MVVHEVDDGVIGGIDYKDLPPKSTLLNMMKLMNFFGIYLSN